MAEPLGPPPVGGDQNRGLSLNAVVWTFICLSTIAFTCRIYTRSRLTRNLGLDDAIMSFSMILLFIQGGLVSASISSGLGRHQYYLTLEQLTGAVEWQVISEPFGIFGVSLPKLAITILLIKIMGPSKSGAAWLWLLNVALNALSIASTIALFAQCKPSTAVWKPVGNYSCWKPSIVSDIAIAQGSLSAFTDFALALFPVLILWEIKIELKKKAAICVLMGLGIFAGASAIIRTSKLAALGIHSDYTWDTVSLVMWVALETNIIIICACIPTLRPLWRSWLGKDIPSPDRAPYAQRFKRSFSDKLWLRSDHSSKGIILHEVPADSQSESSLPAHRIKQTTDIEARWGPV